MSQVIILRNGDDDQDFIVKDGTITVTPSGHFVIDYKELMKTISEINIGGNI